MRNKRGQIQLSFGMIFSIVLIIVFIGFAFFVIQKFLGLQDSVKISQFSDNLQKDVNVVWNSDQSSQTKSYSLPSSIKEVCFVNTNGDDVVLNGANGYSAPGGNIENLNISAITSSSNSCFPVVNGNVNLILQKNFGDTLVTVH
ncbi:MAG: hypothetical protein WAU65_01870 [Candidatus Nanoarchaeia archaeon]